MKIWGIVSFETVDSQTARSISFEVKSSYQSISKASGESSSGHWVIELLIRSNVIFRLLGNEIGVGIKSKFENDKIVLPAANSHTLLSLYQPAS